MNIWKSQKQQWTVLLAFLLFLSSSQSFAQSAFDRDVGSAVEVIAKRTSELLKVKKQTAIVVGQFNNETDLTITSGPRIQNELIQSLTKLGITCALRGEISISGTIEQVLGEIPGENGLPSRKIASAMINYVIKEKGGQVLDTSSKRIDSERAETVITNPNDVFALLGGNGTVFPAGNEQRPNIDERDTQLQKSLDPDGVKDRLDISDESIISSKGSPFSVQLLVARIGPNGAAPDHSAYSPREIAFRDGLPFLTIQPGEAYAIRLINRADFDLAAEVTIDGLDMFTFSDEHATESGTKKGQFVVLPPNKQGEIWGWYRTQEKSDTFLIDNYVESDRGSQIKSPASIGSITVSFHAAWEKNPPADEPKVASDKGFGSVETTQGPPIDAPYKRVSRTIGVLRDGVTIRYDKH
ncbi:MAG: hypothetical protein R3C03_17820 [Pirellulaceae bacterium]